MRKLTTKLAAGFLAVSMLFGAFATNLQAGDNMTSPLFTVEEVFTFPEVFGFNISADGQSLFFMAPVDGILNIFSRDIATGEVTQMTFETEQHVGGSFLKGDTLLFMRDHYGDENPNIFRINPDGTSTNITPFPGVIVVPVNLLEDTDVEDEILVAMNRENPVTFNIYRLNIFNGELTLVMPAVDGIMMDRTGTIRIIVQSDGANTVWMHRYTDEDEFELVTIVSHRDVFSPFMFDADSQFVYALTNVDRETVAIARVNPATAEVLEIIFEHPQVDVTNVIAGVFTPGTIDGVIYNIDKRHIVFFDEEAEAFYNEVEALLPEGSMVSINSISQDFSMAVVGARSDVNRGQTFLFNREAGTVELLADLNFAPARYLAPMVPISYSARDGLVIPGYLTLPVGIAHENLPIVVMPHGGPWIRDYWGSHFDIVQFLANRGYGVFMPNFRGSFGFGRSFLEASYGQWGLAMQDDITDGVLWLIEQGIADPERIGIFGASYGGYATLAGITSTPELYAAAISLVGVSNLFTWIETIPPHWESMREMFYDRVGHPERDYDRLRATSPIFHVDNIVTPLFIAHGANDVRVPLAETTQIVDALTQRGIDVEYMIFWDEGHGLAFEHNRIAFFTMMEAFFAEHLGGRTSTTLADLAAPAPARNWRGQGNLQQGHDDFWGVIYTTQDNVPLNIDGNQGKDMKVIAQLQPEHVGEYIIVFDEFAGGMTQINVAVFVGHRVVGPHMHVHPGDSFTITISPSDVGAEIVIVMSTNCANSGTARISFASE